MFVQRLLIASLLAAVLVAVALGYARPSHGSGAETRYVVRPGDTLWAIAAARYSGDPRAAVWKIERRNALDGAGVTPGQTLVLPAP